MNQFDEQDEEDEHAIPIQKELWETIKTLVQKAKSSFKHLFRFFIFFSLLLGLVFAGIHAWQTKTLDIDLDTLLFILVIVLGMGDRAFYYFFPQIYFRKGIRVMRKCYFAGYKDALPTEFGLISGYVPAAEFMPKIEIKKLEKYAYSLEATEAVPYQTWRGIRRQHYNPLTYGYLFLNKEEMTVNLHVYLHWSTIPFLILWFGAAIFAPFWPVKILFVFLGSVIFLLLFGGEATQYLRIWDVANRFAYGEYSVYQVPTELKKTANSGRRIRGR